MTDLKANLPKEKQTLLGLYVTAKEAYEKWQAKAEKVKILDVRTPEEFLFVGHPPMAWKIPVAAQIYDWDADKKQFPMKPLPDFVSRVKEVAKPDDTIMVMCRSGGRSAIAQPICWRRPVSRTFTTSLMAWRGMPLRTLTASLWGSG
jgi:rhodanese-related sulfurtransferase